MSEPELVRFVLADDYEILEELGRGGMAIVYRAREKALDREVAIKVLPSRLVIDQGFVERFEHEARTAAKLEHPNIVPIYRVGRAGPNADVIYFVMKLLRGQSLSAVLSERGRLDPSDVRRILTETASALNYAARQSVVHRDIKPDNIMLDSEGRCVITDFGIAKAPGGQQTTAGTSLGTPRYMSPEHAMGQQLDGRSDMYSLGVVAYQCLFGKAPFEADEPFAVLYKHIHEPVPEPTLDSDEARQLYPIIARMLAKKPDDRYQTGNELIAALGGQISDPSLAASMIMTSPGLMAPTEVMPTPKPWTMSGWRMLSRTRKAAWSTAAVAAVAALIVTQINAKQAEANGTDSTKAGKYDAAGASLAGGTYKAPGALVTANTPTPSPRAATILSVNRNPGKCPTRDTLPTSAIPRMLRLDTVRAEHSRSQRLPVNYDVCGFETGTRFGVAFTLTKLNQRRIAGLGGQSPFTETENITVGSPRSRHRFPMFTQQLSPGDYQLDVILSNKTGELMRDSTRLKIADK
jgi:serine/threonine protein kinase